MLAADYTQKGLIYRLFYKVKRVCLAESILNINLVKLAKSNNIVKRIFREELNKRFAMLCIACAL